SAPSATRCKARSTASRASAVRPSAWNESGVTFTTPITPTHRVAVLQGSRDSGRAHPASTARADFGGSADGCGSGRGRNRAATILAAVHLDQLVDLRAVENLALEKRLGDRVQRAQVRGE